MRIVRQVTEQEVPPPPTRDGWPPLAVLPLEPADIPDVVWEPGVEDGLGDYLGAGVEIVGGWRLGLVRYRDGGAGTRVYAFTDEGRLPEVLAALLEATGLTREDLPWIAPPAR